MNDKDLRNRLLKPLDKIKNAANKQASSGGTGGGSNPPSGPSLFNTPPDNDMTLMKYVSNPTGKGSAYVAKRATIKEGLNITYIKLLKEFKQAFYAQPYVCANGDLLYYVKVPSELYKINKISYDVVFLLKYDDSKRRPHRLIKMYSNCPSFIFTYCYVYNQHNLVIDSLKTKLPNEALTKAPDTRNPIGSMGYEKSTYIAARYLLDAGCLTDTYVNRYGKQYNSLNQADLMRKIADPDLLISVYQHALYLQRKNHKKPLNAIEKARRDKVNSSYAKSEKENKPKGNFINHTAPKGKISARKAKKALYGVKPKKNKKPKKY